MISVFKEDDKSHNEIYLLTIPLTITMVEINAVLADAVCGHCGQVGTLQIYCEYVRSIIVIENGKSEVLTLALYRVKCTCNRTHVIAPGIQMIPFSRYSLGFILLVLQAYIKREITVRAIAEKYIISVSTIYEWKKRFTTYYTLLKGVLEAKERSDSESVEDVLSDKQISSRLCNFIKDYGFGFMQRSMKNRRTPYIFVLMGFFITFARGSP